MNLKENYYQLLKSNKGRSNEIELGEQLGIDENETQEVISLLLSEHKIRYEPNKTSHYSIMKTTKRHHRK